MKKKYVKVILSLILILVVSIRLNIKTNVFAQNNNHKKDYSYVIDFDDGGHDYVYIVDGLEHHYLVTPDDFDPIHASDEELDRYCYPARPDDKEELAEWEKLVNNCKTRPEPDISINCDNKEPKIKVSEYSSATYSLTSSNWSGYALGSFTSDTTNFSQAQMDYKHPSVTYTTNNCVNSYWVGFGGMGSALKLLQAGTATNYLSRVRKDYAWYECISPTSDTHMVELTSLVVNPNDSIHVYISYEIENNKFTYYIANNTTGNSVSGYVNGLLSSSYYDGTTVEWIVERASDSSGNLMKLANYGTMTPSNCKYKTANNPTWYQLSSYNYIRKINMESLTSGTLISSVSTLFGGSCYTATWHAYN